MALSPLARLRSRLAAAPLTRPAAAGQPPTIAGWSRSGRSDGAGGAGSGGWRGKAWRAAGFRVVDGTRAAGTARAAAGRHWPGRALRGRQTGSGLRQPPAPAQRAAAGVWLQPAPRAASGPPAAAGSSRRGDRRTLVGAGTCGSARRRSAAASRFDRRCRGVHLERGQQLLPAHDERDVVGALLVPNDEQAPLDQGGQGRDDGELPGAGELDEVADRPVAVDQSQQRPLVARRRLGSSVSTTGMVSTTSGLRDEPWTPRPRLAARRRLGHHVLGGTDEPDVVGVGLVHVEGEVALGPAQQVEDGVDGLLGGQPLDELGRRPHRPRAGHGRHRHRRPTARSTARRRAASSQAPRPTRRRARDCRAASEHAPVTTPSVK